MDKTAILIDMLLRATAAVQAYGAALRLSRSEGRDITDAELDGFRASYASERDELQALADAKRNQR